MHRKYKNRRGAMLVLVAVALIILLVGAVFSIDVAYMHMVRAELRTATDAAARAGSETLARTQDRRAAEISVNQIAELNEVAGNTLTLDPADIDFGALRAGSGRRLAFAANQTPLTAVRVNGRREAGAPDGPVNLFFGRVLQTNNFQPTETATAAANVRDVALVLDISGSMASRSGSGTRLSALKDAVNLFISEIQRSSPATQLSLTSYSTSPTKRVNLTDDLNRIRNQVNRFRAGGLTAIGNALTVGSDSLVNDPNQRVFAAKTVIVMTDGNHNRGPSPIDTVSTAVARGQQVHTITFSSGANQSLMRRVAEATDGGIHIHADDAADLGEAFREIARTLSVVLVE